MVGLCALAGLNPAPQVVHAQSRLSMCLSERKRPPVEARILNVRGFLRRTCSVSARRYRDGPRPGGGPSLAPSLSRRLSLSALDILTSSRSVLRQMALSNPDRKTCASGELAS